MNVKKQLTAQDWCKMIGNKIACHIIGSEDNTVEYTLVGVYQSQTEFYLTVIYDDNYDDTKTFSASCIDFCKPILRTINQITKEEEEELFERYAYSGCLESCKICPAGKSPKLNTCLLSASVIIDYLDSIGIDCRGWIEDGLAIKEDI